MVGRDFQAAAASLDDAVRAACAIMATRPAALITDIDGTISPIVGRPEAAIVAAEAVRGLEALADVLDLVAVVTAREADVARRMVGSSRVTYVGNYGLTPAGIATPDLIALRQDLSHLIERRPCLTLEAKGVGFALHYRNCSDPAAVRVDLLRELQPLSAAAGLRLQEGKQVVELLPAALPDKGAAVAALVAQHNLQAVIYLGDDLSDMAVFETLRQQRQAGRMACLSIAVLDAETPAAVRAAADLTLNGVAQVEQFLSGLSQALTRPGGGA